MTRDEQRATWQVRIEAFKAGGESSIIAWCATNNIGVQSMYTWPMGVLIYENQSTD